MKIIENPDKNIVKEIREKIAKNEGHCCCAVTFNDDNKCMCKEFRDQISRGEKGFCNCGLYIFADIDHNH